MIAINFYPESDLKDFSEAVIFFREYWNNEGLDIIKKIEEISGLSFVETEINALVSNVKSSSHPLTLRYNNEENIKKAVLIHELVHRILFQRKQSDAILKTSLDVHKFLFLILTDIFLELYGEKFLEKAIIWDSNLSDMYQNSWQWTKKYKTKTERQVAFKEILNGNFLF